MANSDFYLIVYSVACLASVVAAAATWWLCIIIKNGLDAHLGVMQAIHEEVRRSNASGRNPAESPRDRP